MERDTLEVRRAHDGPSWDPSTQTVITRNKLYCSKRLTGRYTFVESNTYVDLIILEMVDFDVILGMTWLSLNFAIFDCNGKTVTLAKRGTDPLVWEGDYISTIVRIIFFLRSKRMVSKGCLSFLAHLRDNTSKVPSIESVLIVNEFLDVFLTNLPGIPPDRDINFCIDLELGTRIPFPLIEWLQLS